LTFYLQIYIYYLLSVPPSIDIVGINTNPKVKQGQPHTLICPARGTPPPDITWYKDGQPKKMYLKKTLITYDLVTSPLGPTPRQYIKG
jgi:hypothetical protein